MQKIYVSAVTKAVEKGEKWKDFPLEKPVSYDLWREHLPKIYYSTVLRNLFKFTQI